MPMENEVFPVDQDYCNIDGLLRFKNPMLFDADWDGLEALWIEINPI